MDFLNAKNTKNQQWKVADIVNNPIYWKWDLYKIAEIK